MIKDIPSIIKYVSTWIGTYANSNGKNKLVVGISSDISSIVTAYFCSKIGLYDNVIRTTKPSVIGVHLATQSELPNSIKLLDNICSIEIIPHTENSKGSIGIKLLEYTDLHNGLLVGTVNFSNGQLNRGYCKYGPNGLGDIFPILDIYQSEVEQLAETWFGKGAFKSEIDKNLEWAGLENDYTDIINSDIIPSSRADWYRYTLSQKQIISLLHAREKKTRHKSLISKPYCRLRNIKELFTK